MADYEPLTVSKINIEDDRALLQTGKKYEEMIRKPAWEDENFKKCLFHYSPPYNV